VFDHCLYFNTTALARVVEREWATAFKPFGLTPPQAFLLRVVLAGPDRGPHELATELTIARPTATRLIDGLEKLGLLERRAHARDGRRTTVHPTKRALLLRAPLDEASARVTQRIQRLVGAKTFADTVNRVKEVCTAMK
jgi:DNA-binding MarR family transcriptional regulator